MYRGWEKEIQKDLEDKKRSVMFALGEQNEIEKGQDFDLNPSVKIFNGSEIKDKLLNQRSDCAVKLAHLSNDLQLLKSQLIEEPSKEIIKSVMGYSFDQIYSKDDGNSDMRNFNKLTLQVENLKKDIGIYTTLINGLKEDKNYKLPIMVASQLGF